VCFAETGLTDKIILYTEVIYTPDYVTLQPGEFASQLANDENGALVDCVSSIFSCLIHDSAGNFILTGNYPHLPWRKNKAAVECPTFVIHRLFD